MSCFRFSNRQKRLPAKIDGGDVKLDFSVHGKKGFKIPGTSEISCLDIDVIKFPLILRTWQQGDRFHPLGMKTNKKVSDFLVDIKMPVNDKENIKVLVSENRIICLP